MQQAQAATATGLELLIALKAVESANADGLIQAWTAVNALPATPRMLLQDNVYLLLNALRSEELKTAMATAFANKEEEPLNVLATLASSTTA